MEVFFPIRLYVKNFAWVEFESNQPSHPSHYVAPARRDHGENGIALVLRVHAPRCRRLKRGEQDGKGCSNHPGEMTVLKNTRASKDCRKFYHSIDSIALHGGAK